MEVGWVSVMVVVLAGCVKVEGSAVMVVFSVLVMKIVLTVTSKVVVDV